MALAIEPEDAQFESKLDEASLIRAKEELNENAKDRICAVQSFRNLILQEKWLKTPTDFSFLLRFLRYRKFSQLSARETLENYWTIKTKYPGWFANLDPADKTLQAIMRTGFYFSPIKPDKGGRRIVTEAVGKLDMNSVKKEFGADNVFRTIMLICEWLKTDEHVQVNGIIMFIDCTNVTMQHHLKLYNMDSIKKMIQYYQNSMPSRNKGAHIYNEPPFFDAVWALIRPLLNEKTRNRMFLHGKNLANVYDTIDVSLLPEEYLPDDYTGPCAGTAEQRK